MPAGAAALNRDGRLASVGLVVDLMRELGVRACQPRADKRTTLPGEQPVDRPELIDRDVAPAAPGQRLVGDITSLKTGEGWLSLATVIDLATRMVLGWPLAKHLPANLVTEAIAMAITGGHAPPDALFPSDRGCQYTSMEFTQFHTSNKLLPSLGRTGVCRDNAAAESFFATLKNEIYHRQKFDTRARARFAVAEHIEIFYNRQRLHSHLGYRTPAAALADHQARTAARPRQPRAPVQDP